MSRMKGNRGSGGQRLPEIDFPFELRPPPREPGRSDHLGWLMALLGVLALGAVAAVGVVFALTRDGEPDAQPAASSSVLGDPVTAVPAAPSSTAAASAPATASPATATPTRTAAATPTTPTTPTATATTIATATLSPAGPPTVRQRYVVVNGDACDLIRQRYRFAPADFDDFITALGRLSGRTPAQTCSFFPGAVLCVPAQADLSNLAALMRDDRCLAGT